MLHIVKEATLACFAIQTLWAIDLLKKIDGTICLNGVFPDDEVKRLVGFPPPHCHVDEVIEL